MIYFLSGKARPKLSTKKSNVFFSGSYAYVSYLRKLLFSGMHSKNITNADFTKASSYMELNQTLISLQMMFYQKE